MCVCVCIFATSLLNQADTPQRAWPSSSTMVDIHRAQCVRERLPSPQQCDNFDDGNVMNAWASTLTISMPAVCECLWIYDGAYIHDICSTNLSPLSAGCRVGNVAPTITSNNVAAIFNYSRHTSRCWKFTLRVVVDVTSSSLPSLRRVVCRCPYSHGAFSKYSTNGLRRQSSL